MNAVTAGWCRLAGSSAARLRRALMLLMALSAAALVGCGLFGGAPKPVRPEWQKLTIVAAEDANGNSALAMDVVLVKDKVVLESLKTMPATSYFAARDNLLRSFPDGLTVLQVEITPGQKIEFDRKRITAEAIWAALVFANYTTPGEHRTLLRLDNDGYVVRLNAQEFVVSDSKTGAAR